MSLSSSFAASLLCLLALVTHSQEASQSVPRAVLVQVNSSGRPVVSIMATASIDIPKNSQALVIWGDSSGERWRVVSEHWEIPESAHGTESRLISQGSVRSGIPAIVSGDLVTLTTPLEQLSGPVVIRGWQLLAPPAGGRLLEPSITIRRVVADKDPTLPAVQAALLRDGKEVARIPFKEDQATVVWADIPGLPDHLKKGLPAGTYTLKVPAQLGPQTISFTVESDTRRAEVMKRPDELARLLDGHVDPLWAQVTVEHLLGQKDRNGRPQPFLADALNTLDRVPLGARTPALESLREHIIARLKDPGQNPWPRWCGVEPTGIAEIDVALTAIAAAEWSQAQTLLAAIASHESPAGKRRTALAELYRGVVASESGVGREEEATACFHRALEGLKGGEPGDLFRAHNNVAGFLLTRAIDQLHNQSFQMATGAPRSLQTTLALWANACHHYEQAAAEAQKLGPNQRASALVNQARLYVVLGDLLRTLRHPTDPIQRFETGEQAADALAGRLARLARDEQAGGKEDALITGTVEQILAHLAFRSGAMNEAIEHGGNALAAYGRAGSLVGAESVYRLLGLCQLRLARSTGGTTTPDAAHESALPYFLISHHLSEHLRERYPANRSGLSQAGFFARRAYVYEQIVELLLAKGEHGRALHFVELAKARALRDLLTSRRISGGGQPAMRELSEILRSWPSEVVALEYFLGTDRAWVFVVGPGGRVQAHPLLDRAGQPVASRDLVSRIHRLLGEMDHLAAKMRTRLLAGRGFDHSWQDVLHDLRHELIPEPALAEMRRARSVVVIPQHILHYFPFAALVTQPDVRERKANEMVQPRFLLDESFDLSLAPSLQVWNSLQQQPLRAIREVNAIGIVAVPGASPLQGVEEELGHLRSIFQEKIRTVVEESNANRQSARQLLGKSGLLLIATHGLNYPDRPLESHLMLYPRTDDDGRLTAAEVYNLDVDSDVVVLNACYSGLADRSPVPGDDLFGLQRALVQAGARNVVSGTWDIYDGTGPLLMRGFFERLARSETAAIALAGAQRDFVKQCRATSNDPWLHPYFWAVYSVVGR